MKPGVNLFGLNELASAEFARTAERLAAYGYGSVEPMVMLACDRAEMEHKPFIPKSMWQQDELIGRSRFLKEEYGMRITSIHFGGLPGEDFSTPAKIGSLLEIMEKTDVRDFVMSRMLRTEAEIRRDVDIFLAVEEQLRRHGGRLLYHNHEAEEAFLPAGDGREMIMDRFLRLCGGAIHMEVDAGWTLFGGADEVAFLEGHREHVARIHLKDFKPGFSAERREKDIVAVGEGVLRLREILAFAARQGLADDEIIVDQDCSPVDLMDDLRRSVAHIREAGG